MVRKCSRVNGAVDERKLKDGKKGTLREVKVSQKAAAIHLA